ncbi:2Fe-2S iron-sulfur cluster-binding protein [Novosphingobium sp. G106]|uniref:2Fe-2S iron-sulfur cluster-binding protein n=1 Tax=Novosphingobium sp. G106 TaxID=2849500 RepID=UPI002810FD29|nr:2Fe-2S iron-sulfur cluster-binding protein [Novosphingobium sp. G106]
MKITFVENDGTKHEVDVEVGQSLMRAALDHGVPGIMADCGGMCTCATCHCYLSESAFAAVAPPSDDERDMLECALDIRPSSRLSCQVMVTPELDGTSVEIPATQI